jgi:AbrB family looped-hinge helix DNA binding protein
MRITSKGQVTIPQHIREALGLLPDTEVEFELDKDAEVSARFERVEELAEALPDRYYRRLPLPRPAAFLARQCFVSYRRKGGPRRLPMPDFYIGAHAALDGLTLLTRDASRYREYFPALTIIGP